jgi:DNA processing protein
MGAFSLTELQGISFRILGYRDPGGMYNFKRDHGSRSSFFTLSSKDLSRYGFSLENLRLFRDNFTRAAEQEIDLAGKNGVELIFMNSGYFPPLLKEIYDPPEFLYVKGNKMALKTNMLAIVGSRKGDGYGKRVLSGLIPDLVAAGITIVSGMAYGIDSMSHRAAVDNGGYTIGVNAGGLLNIYPAGNSFLTGKIITNGCVISEFPLESTPRPQYFPMRNRIIAGISKGVLVVEAERKSGSLITARLALEQNRDIYAIPGMIDSPLSRGTNYLIQQGAKLILSAEDILSEYGIKKKRVRAVSESDLNAGEKKILDLMNTNGVNSIDYFVENTGTPVPEIISILMGMVLKNLISEENGGFRRIK